MKTATFKLLASLLAGVILLTLPASLVAQDFKRIQLGKTVSPSGVEATVDFPLPEHISNIGSKRDGLGMCVTTSMTMAAIWANLEQMRELRDWCANEGGGSYPAKVDDQVPRYCKAKGIPVPEYIQYEGKDPAILELGLKTGRMVCVTYAGRDGVRYSGPIAHMVCLIHLDRDWAGIWDNNGTPGQVIWLPREEFLSRWKGGRDGWAFIWLAPPPPPVPRGQKRMFAVHADFDAPPPLVSTFKGIEWKWLGGALFKNDRQVGYYDGTTYRERTSEGWSLVAEGPPVDPRQPVVKDYGVSWDRVEQKGYTVRGRRERLPEIEAALTDDSELPRLTVIGPKSERDKVLADLQNSPELAPWKGKVVVQGYEANARVLQGLGFVTGGSPTIYLQRPDGTVVHRQDDYRDGVEGLVSALRKADPSYQPTQDTDLRLTILNWLGFGPILKLWPFLIMGLVLLLALTWPVSKEKNG